MMPMNRGPLLIISGLTLVVVGYFAVWLPGPAAGLRLIGLELGEWIKFLGVGAGRNLFYLPPICAGLVIALVTTGWDNRAWRTWVMRLLAVAVALVALPAFASITGEPRSEWLLRVVLIVLVAGVSLLVSLAPRSQTLPAAALWGILGVAMVGLALPAWQYVAVLPVVESILDRSLGIGLGVWLNTAGFGLIALGAGLMLRRIRLVSYG